MHENDFGVHGAREVHGQLRREGILSWPCRSPSNKLRGSSTCPSHPALDIRRAVAREDAAGRRTGGVGYSGTVPVGQEDRHGAPLPRPVRRAVSPRALPSRLTGPMELYALASLAVVAGVVSFTSPCALPLVPGFVSYVAGMQGDAGGTGWRARRPAVAGAALFVLGFTVVFTALGATASAVGLLLAQNLRAINVVSGGLVALMGLVGMGALRVPVMQRQARLDLSRVGRGPRSAPLLGAAFAFGWTPCVGPVLAGILATAAGTGTTTRGALLLMAYSLGLGIPFLLVAAGLGSDRARARLARHGRRLEVAGGLLLVTMGVALMTGGWTTLMSSLLRQYARWGWPPI